MSHNKYLTKVAEIADREGSYGSPSNQCIKVGNRYLEKIAENYQLEKEAFLPVVAGAVLRAGASALVRSGLARTAGSSATRGFSMTGAHRAASARGWAGKPVHSRAQIQSRNATEFGSSSFRKQLTAGIKNPVTSARGSISSGLSRAKTTAGSLANRVGSGRAGKALATAGHAGNVVGMGMMVNDVVGSAGASTAQAATQATQSAGQRAMTAAARPQGGWGGAAPGWNTQGAGGF